MCIIWKLETYFISMLNAFIKISPVKSSHFRNYEHPLTLQIIVLKEIIVP